MKDPSAHLAVLVVACTQQLVLAVEGQCMAIPEGHFSDGATGPKSLCRCAQGCWKAMREGTTTRVFNGDVCCEYRMGAVPGEAVIRM